MIKIEKIYDPDNFHFVTEYPENKYIEKTVAYGYETDSNRKLVRMGRMEIYLRNGEQHTFECWVGSSYCAQYGIQVSHDGEYVYVISDEKGLWCYTYKGELVWKTRYTSVSYVIPHLDNHVTCVTTTRLFILDTAGKVIKQVPIYCESMSELVSDSVIVANKSETIVALFDGFSLDVLCKISLKALGLKYICKAHLNENVLEIRGYSLKGETVTIGVDLAIHPAVIHI